MAMETVETLVIHPNQTIEIQVPELGKKVNYYYQPMKDLHCFDEVTIVYRDKKNEYFLGRDVLQSLIGELYGTIKALLAGKYNVPLHLKGYVGLQVDKDELLSREVKKSSEEYKITIGMDFILWDNIKDLQTLMYRINDKYYLEISPQYEWLFGPLVKEDDEDIDEEPEGFYSFEEYEKKYKPLVVAELSKETLLDWKKKCENIFDKVGIRSLFK